MPNEIENRVLLIDRCYLPMMVVSWREAISLVYGYPQRATIIKNYYEKKRHDGKLLRPSVIQMCIPTPHPSKYIRPTFSRRNLLIRDRYRCQYCGSSHKNKKDKLTIDHVTPRSKGGGNSFKNCVVACMTCNQAKGNKTLEEAGMTLLNKPVQPHYRWLLYSTTHLEHWKEYLIGVDIEFRK